MHSNDLIFRNHLNQFGVPSAIAPPTLKPQTVRSLFGLGDRIAVNLLERQ
jgi:hypothetical protein